MGWMRLVGWGAVAAVLLVVMAANHRFGGFDWTASDFVFAGVMFGGTGLLLELAVRASGDWAYRGGMAVALVTNFLLIWINLAVGIIGSEDNPANLMYAGVIATLVGGACIARFRPAGMARALLATGAAQAAVGVIALTVGLGNQEPPGPRQVFVLNLIFTGLWLASAWLFGRAMQARH